MTEEGKETPVSKPDSGFGSDDRARANEAYSKHTASMDGMGDKSEPSLPESTQEDTPTETPPAEGVAEPSPEDEGKEGFEPEQAPSGEVEEKKSGDEAKTVPLEALHAERERRKDLQTKQGELEGQVNTLLQDIREREERDSLKDESVEDSDVEIVKLKREIQELKNKDANRDADSQARMLEEVQRKNAENIANTAKSLLDEGYPGFAFAQAAVAEEINKDIAADSDNDYMLNSPDAWKRVYKERVFPKLQGAFTTKERAEKDADKEALKEKANLAGNAGKPNTPPKKEKGSDTWTFDDYAKMRRKGGFGH